MEQMESNEEFAARKLRETLNAAMRHAQCDARMRAEEAKKVSAEAKAAMRDVQDARRRLGLV